MKGTHRALIAAQPRAWRVLQTTLADVADLVPAHTTAEAFKILERERIDLIVCTIAFDDSQMIDFLQTVKRTTPGSGIPFLCTRVLQGIVRDKLVAGMREACKECGALDLVDVANLPPDRARAMLRAAAETALASGPARA